MDCTLITLLVGLEGVQVWEVNTSDDDAQITEGLLRLRLQHGV